MIETRQQCSHTAQWSDRTRAPKPGERIYCERCDDMREVVSITGSYHAYCRGCRWRMTRLNVEKLKGQVKKHLEKTGHIVTVTNHDETETVTCRTPHAAASVGNHSASVAAMARVLPPSGDHDTLF